METRYQIRRDNKVVYNVTDDDLHEDTVMSIMHRIQGSSMFHALAYEGYTIHDSKGQDITDSFGYDLTVSR